MSEIEASGDPSQHDTVYQALAQREAWLRREWNRLGCGVEPA